MIIPMCIQCRTLVAHLTTSPNRVFGCSAFAHQKEGKLDPRSIKCVFLGYGDGVKGHRLWSLEHKGTRLMKEKKGRVVSELKVSV